MAIYGNYLADINSNHSALFDEDANVYIDDLFLETSLNESVGSISKAIDDLAKKEDITQDDINKIYDDIKYEEDKNLRAKKTTLFISSGLSNILGFLDVLSLFKKIPLGFLLTKKWKIASFFGNLLLNGFNFLLKNDISVDAYYKKLLLIEAKSKVQLKALELERTKTAAKENVTKTELDRIDSNIYKVERILSIVDEIKNTRREQLAKTNRTYHEDTLLVEEFKGDAIKNEKFISVLEDIDRVCKANVDRLDLIHKYVSKMESIIRSKSVKNKVDSLDKLNAKLEYDLKKTSDVYAPLAFKLLKQESRSLNNILSSTSLETKEKFKSKLDKYTEILNKKFESIDDTEARIYSLIDKTISDHAEAKKVHSLVSECEGIYRNELSLTKKDISKVYSLLNIDKQKSNVLFKLLNGDKK